MLTNSCGFKILFDRWANDIYTGFYAKLDNLENGIWYDTDCYTLASEKESKDFIASIEQKLGGNLNLTTLEIEKHPEFKDGDIVFMREVKSEFSANCIFILRWEYNGEGKALYHAFYNADDKFVCAGYGSTRVHYNLRLATDEERQQLFDALAKENKKWDAEKKAIVDLPKKYEFEPFQKVLVRCKDYQKWKVDFFSHYDDSCKEFPYVCVSSRKSFCIPYNEDTKHLLGTTDEWKGGEG